MGYLSHVRLLVENGIQVVYQWRNLGDVIVSFDDHVLQQGHVNPVCYIDNPEEFAAQPASVRHRYLIRHALPWYIEFHLQWLRWGEPAWLIRCRYEDMVMDRHAFFSRIIKRLSGTVDEIHLKSILDTTREGTRFNRGIVGRSVELLSEDNKALIESMLREHINDLSALLDELPWRRKHNIPVKSSAPYDGRLVRIPGDLPAQEKLYYVRNGKRRWILSPEWLKYAGLSFNSIEVISPKELEQIPLGPPIRM